MEMLVVHPKCAREVQHHNKRLVLETRTTQFLTSLLSWVNQLCVSLSLQELEEIFYGKHDSTLMLIPSEIPEMMISLEKLWNGKTISYGVDLCLQGKYNSMSL